MEKMLIDDCLNGLCGLSGDHLTLDPNNQTFTVSPQHIQQQHAGWWNTLQQTLIPLMTDIQTCRQFTQVQFRTNYLHTSCDELVLEAVQEHLTSHLQDLLLFTTQLDSLDQLNVTQLHAHLQQQSQSQKWKLFAQVTADLLYSHSCISHNQSKPLGNHHTLAVPLDVIHVHLMKHRGFPQSREWMEHLLLHASQPYLSVLMSWLWTGKLQVDSGFMVVDTKSSLKKKHDSYSWENKYEFRSFLSPITGQEESGVPIFLEPLMEKILLAGKYWNVLRECSLQDNCISDAMEMADAVLPRTMTAFKERKKLVEYMKKMNGEQQDVFEVKSLMRTVSDAETVDQVITGELEQLVDQAYIMSNTRLLTLLNTRYSLAQQVETVITFFYMHGGDFFAALLDNIGDDLSTTPAGSMSGDKLHGAWDSALIGCSFEHGELSKFINSIKVSFAKISLVDQLSRILDVTGDDNSQVPRHRELTKTLVCAQTLVLEYEIPFPVSLVLSQKAMTKYQLIFRHLFTLECLHRHLSQSWIDQQSAYQSTHNKSSDGHLVAVLHSASQLRAKMMYFCRSLMYFTHTQVLAPHSAAFLSKLTTQDSAKTMSSVDDLIGGHTDFLDTCLKECLLTNRDAVFSIGELISVCTQFCSASDRFMKSLSVDTSCVSIAEQTSSGKRRKSVLEMFNDIVAQSSVTFSQGVKKCVQVVRVMGTEEYDYRVGMLASLLEDGHQDQNSL